MRDSYDVVIIGAGVAGLICGAYLAKNGIKVLILERGAKVGGYCTSFKFRNFEFDAFVHSLGNISENGELHKLMSYLGIKNELEIIRHNPSDVISTPDFKVSYWNDFSLTIEDFIRTFPDEHAGIKYFFQDLLFKKGFDSVAHFRNKTFKNILDEVFTDQKLKQVLSIVILGNLGVPAEKISGFTAIKHYKQFMIDGGYYLKHGIQSFPQILAKKIEQFGGEILLSRTVKKILVNKNKAVGVELQDGQKIMAKFIVSACDARQTFFGLIGREYLSDNIANMLTSLTPSLSLFVLYLAMDKTYSFTLPDGVNSWFIDDYNYSRSYCDNRISTDFQTQMWMIRPNYEKRTLTIYTNAPFISHEFWEKTKDDFLRRFLEKINHCIPGILEKTLFYTSANPSVLYKWTLNFDGAGYGWASINSQFMMPEFTSDAIFRNLFLAGHWSTAGQGVPGVSIVGERVGLKIIKRLRANIKLGRKNVQRKLVD